MPSRKLTDHFDLLPYISILMCTLGTLLLMTVSMTAINLGPGVGIGIVQAVDTNNMTKLAVLIEWDGHMATVHQGDRREAIRVDQPRRTFEDGEIKIVDETEKEKLDVVLK